MPKGFCSSFFHKSDTQVSSIIKSRPLERIPGRNSLNIERSDSFAFFATLFNDIDHTQGPIPMSGFVRNGEGKLYPSNNNIGATMRYYIVLCVV
jgi:hypothetical protein